MRVVDVLAVFGGAQVVVTGLLAFAGKAWLNLALAKQRARVEAELESLRAEASANNLKLQHFLDRRLHVHVAQFDKELRVYEQTWATLIDVVKAVAQLRPVLDHFDPAQTEDERKSARLSRLGEAAQRYLDQVNKERPFYATEVYKSLQELAKIVRVEAVEYQYGDASKLGSYWEKALGNAEAIRAKVDEICETIRGRIDGISAA